MLTLFFIRWHLLCQLVQGVDKLSKVLLQPQSVPVVDCGWQGVQSSVGQQGEASLLHQELALMEPDGFRRGHVVVVEIPQECLLGRGGGTQTPQGIGRCGGRCGLWPSWCHSLITAGRGLGLRKKGSFFFVCLFVFLFFCLFLPGKRHHCCQMAFSVHFPCTSMFYGEPS